MNSRRIEPLSRHKKNRVRKIANAFVAIELTKGQNTIVDIADYLEELYRYRFYVVFEGGGEKQYPYAKTHAMVDGKLRGVKLHQIVAEMYGHPLGSYEEIDHKDGNGLNNMWSNLAPGTKRDNQCNQKSQREGTKTSRYSGVSWKADRCKWWAQIRFKGQVIYLGSFEEEEEARKAYENAKSRIDKGLYPREEEK